MRNLTISQLHRARSGKVGDKWASYLDYYDALLSPLRELPISLLEIGVQNGGSIETWASYFRNASVIVGCDINPKCAALTFEDPRIRVVVGDINAPSIVGELLSMAGGYDVVIDDGSHVSSDVIRSFVNYFPAVNPGGLYVVEDAHCLYFSEFGGGVLNEAGAYAFFKRLIDVVNFEFWQPDVGLEAYLSAFFGAGAFPQFISEGWIDAVEFRNSIITIRKAHQSGHNKLGDRVISGELAQVQPLKTTV